ncbi:unnamed protein product [Polarella glacialis]|uniref:Uncharacterized protein n=1 Tax=Polarella glacialis TaxID=89957 RepID=A0A813K269_POLGL|nr:unnamed protein product [Polarella glacialis]CAE8692213.1 unnamed protein product [Polarella glacialis]|mmetsp:Transcript_69473/g.125257  ORF Transcript_69473/g.125257 Transcript_69473/m.125257 type:complete len:375 (+) Transcript_69473:58-1182(+)|eukprot:CAMPEP_0115165334 /NCGR_PEP_ID=MMETSP0227-20121206/73541_1 /TAXON_ID=89957 /ORGANISM="Polarella glacialis, Strain CCMP 1383" /LENGTH=374 /DNA_ID=CAMNT_0002577807 /DNA_START=45 /DNA_END=1169 /DNA_ORIENTATION=+
MEDAEWWVVVAAIVGSTVLLAGVCVLLLVCARALWDPIYCCHVSGPQMQVLHSSPMHRVTDTVHICEHIVTSGASSCLQRKITKYSRMVIVSHGEKLGLFNPCPLTDAVKKDIDKLGQVDTVCATNCFHYMCIHAYIAAYPGARFIVPAGLLLKRPQLRGRCEPYPEPPIGSVFPGTRYFRLPEFHQEHLIFVEDAALLWAADTISPHQPAAPNPGRTVLSPFMWPFLARLCVHSDQFKSQYGRPGAILFADYSRQFTGGDRRASVAIWQEVLGLPITRVSTAHGLYSGWVDVTKESLQALLEYVKARDTCWDLFGRFVFRTIVLGCCHCCFPEWTPLFKEPERSESTEAACAQASAVLPETSEQDLVIGCRNV